MSESKTTNNKTAGGLRAETQQERWVKYGLNVLLVSVVVVLLAAGVIWLAQQKTARLDTTQAGLYSLKPQTVNIIKNNQQEIRIVSLYTRAKAQGATYEQQQRVAEQEQFDEVTPVNDLLEEYERKGNKIKVEAIDPVAQASKVDQLVQEVANKYGGEIQKYKAVTEAYPNVYETISTLAQGEVQKVRGLPVAEVKDPELLETLGRTFATIQRFPRLMANMKEAVDRRLQQKIPDYKGAVEAIRSGATMLASVDGMEDLSKMLGQILADFDRFQKDEKIPQAIRSYMEQSRPTYARMKEAADGLLKQIGELGELKLDDLKNALKQPDTILVMGESEWRIIPKDKVWKEAEELPMAGEEGKLQRRFAGEQQVTSAILAVSNSVKPKVVFVRPGGPPLTTPGAPPFIAGGPLSEIALRLQEYNFQVMEKDLSGTWAMQSRMQRMAMPPAPEPSDEEMKDAVWVVVAMPSRGGPMGGPAPSNLGPRLAEHLKNGGSAMVLGWPSGEGLVEALAERGVSLRTDVVAVHEPVTGGARAADIVEQAQRDPLIFVVNQYGDHLVTNPVNSLDGIVLPMMVVESQAKAGYKTTKILPVPENLKVWGETNLEQALSSRRVAYDAPKGASIGGDLPPPLWSGAIVEKEGGKERLVVIGSAQFVMDDLLTMPDLRYAPRYVARFPGNGELFMNSVFWLARQEPMIAISPSAMQVSRIREMGSGLLNFWRVGVLLVGLPLAVMLAGGMVYAARRD